MRPLDISTRMLTDMVWRRILETSANRLLEKRQSFFELMASLESLRIQASYDTGSISTSTAWALYSLAHYFRPQRMLEVGTFIGKSTLALALGAEDAGVLPDIHTCDMSNDLALPRATRCAIRQYPRTTSTAMLGQIAQARSPDAVFDLLHFDGRLQNEDIPLLRTMCSPNAIVALDDFEGVEKGVANLINMRSAGFLNTHLTVYPCPHSLLREFGFADHSTTALLVPQGLLRLTAQ